MKPEILPTMGGSYLREADGSLTPMDGPAMVEAPGPIDMSPEPEAVVAADEEKSK